VIKRVAVVKRGVNNEVAMVEAVLESRCGGYREAEECGNSRIWRQMTTGQKR